MKRHIVSMLIASALIGCASRAPIDTALVEQPRLILTDEYLIGPDDVVQVSVWRNPELSVTVPVRPDGMISVPLLGDVSAGGKTPMAVASDIEESLSAYLRAPKVAVIVTDLQSHEFLTRVRVTGAVKTPSTLPYRQGITVLDAVLAAGGVNDFADPNSARLYRKKEDSVSVYSVDLEGILKKGELMTNYELQPGDIITVPERLF